ncbi:hypothetical protein VNO78_15117 [Psophocarpus tetragonolobus]|uniref:Uncharacterized protein n=1 Tax=Psophocarpus tetragonolobus TaxID=3891 RepID=A0AAN9SFW8_PSOTE
MTDAWWRNIENQIIYVILQIAMQLIMLVALFKNSKGWLTHLDLVYGRAPLDMQLQSLPKLYLEWFV